MLTLRCKWILTLIIAFSITLSTNVIAYDVSVSDLEWNYPQTLTPDTGEIQYSYRFQLSPSPYPSDCYYTSQLYLSQDRILSDDDVALFGPTETLLPAGAIGFTSTVTKWFYTETSLPTTGTYYIFLEITPGLNAPSDTDSTNNTTMAPNPVQVENGTAPTPSPPSQPTLTTATVVMSPLSGLSLIVAGYSNGVLEFCDWQGNILASREDFKEITALATGIVGSPPLPRLFVASTDSNGTLHAVDPTDIDQDIISHSNLGRITAIDVRGGSDASVYIGTSDIEGALRKLNALTLTNEGVRGSLGQISDIIQIHSTWGNVLAVGTDASGGSVYFVDMDTLDDAVPRQQHLGSVYALSSADMDRDGQAELVIASDADGGSVQLREGPSFESVLSKRSGLGQTYTLDYGALGDEPFIGAWILYAGEPKGGSLNVMFTNLDASTVKLQDWARRSNLGLIRYVKLHDFYMAGTPLVGAVWQDDAGPAFHVLDENLTEPVREPVTTEDFETGDFSNFAWERSEGTGWVITSQEKNSGIFCAESGPIDHGDSSILELSLQCESGNITFSHKVSCEPSYDYLAFAIDGVPQATWSGESDWAEASFDVTAGTRTFTWTYSKDSSVSRGDDKAWIDDIEFPIGGAEKMSSTIRSVEQPPCRIDIEYTFDK
ncbi:MAG: hypothetical protein JXM79_25670 [Sedimentisphaerales bacterium]|nr:hypothetical protein [Sedimentisphaerales bacterium]